MAFDGELPWLCRRLAGELGIARDVAVAVCDRLAAPVLVGIVRPLICCLPRAGRLASTACASCSTSWYIVRRQPSTCWAALIWTRLFFRVQRPKPVPLAKAASGSTADKAPASARPVRAYAETLLSLADPDLDGTLRAAVALAGNDLVARVRRILNLDPEGYAMKLPRGLLALTAAILIFPTGWTISRARLAAPPGKAQAKSGTDAIDPDVDLRALVARANDLTEAIANSRRDPKERVRALLDLGASKAQGGDAAGGVAVLHKTIDMIKAMHEEEDRVSATKMLAERLALAGAADEAIAMAASLEDNAQSRAGGLSATLHTITWYLAASGNVAKAIEAARGIRDKDLLGYALGTIADAQARQGDAAAAMRTVESIEPAEARIRALVGTSSGREHPGLAVTRGREGDRVGARECLDRARALTATFPNGPKNEGGPREHRG